MKNISKFTKGYLNYRKPTATGGISYVERLPAGSNESGKTHLMLHFRKIVMGEASALIKHEEKILDHLTKRQVPYTVRLLDYQNSPDYQQPEKSTQTIVTQAAGVDLDDWFEAPIFINELNRSLDNIYEHPFFVLAILKGSLNALWQIHQLDIIHCDIKMDNICLPYHGGEVDKGENIQIQLDKVTLIDFGTSYWIGNLGNSERLWLGYNENENERYQSRFLINILKKWNQDNHNKSEPPYNNTSLNQINYSCDLYGLGVAFTYFCTEHQYADVECWSLVNDDFNAIIRELKSYDNGIPTYQTQMPHQKLMQKLDILIQKVVSYEHAQGNTIYPSHVNGKMTALPKSATRRTPPVPTPTPFPLPANINTPPPIVNADPEWLSETTTSPISEKKGFGKKLLIGGGALLLAAGGLAMLNNNSSPPEYAVPASIDEAQIPDEVPIETAEPNEVAGAADTSKTTSTPNIFDELENNLIDYSQFKLIKTINVSSSSVQALDFSPDNKHIVTASDATQTSSSNAIFDVITGEKIKEFKGGNTGVVYAPNSKIIATASSDESMIDNKISIYSINKDNIISEYPSESYLSNLGFSVRGNYLAYGEDDRVIVKNTLSNDNITISDLGHLFSFISEDYPNMIAVVGSDINIIDLNTKKVIFNVPAYYYDNQAWAEADAPSIIWFAISPNGRVVATVDNKNTLRVGKIDFINGSSTAYDVIKSDYPDELILGDLIFTRNSLHLIHKNYKSLDVYRVSDMKKTASISIPENTWSVDISSDGKYIAVGTGHPKGQVLIYGIE